MTTNKRLAYLEQTVAGGSKDPFTWYALALEYRNLDRSDEALKAFESLRNQSPDYVPMYLMCGGLLEKLQRKEDARVWYEQGISAARAKGDTHALGELQAALTASL